MLKLDLLRLVFVDESGFKLDMTPTHAYAPKGERAYGKVPKNRGENTSLIAALSLDGGVNAAMTLTGAVDGVAFESYVREVLCPQLRPGQVVILDRLSVHRRKEVREAVAAKGCDLLFLPGYSPDLNPIELAFSKLKQWVRRAEARTRQTLDHAIAAALHTITLQDVIGWFEYAGYSHHSL